ncbi:MAG: class I SAM-dependent methyltransferase [Gemmatimonadota bacterium]|nr:class I SAM-dependent methyltransferase [Gemmatimonadota bacterium]
MPDNRPLNRDSYAHIAAEWDRARREFVHREAEYLDALLDGAPAGSLVLDAGCGTGRPMADALVKRGFRVVGVDQSPAMLARARARLPHERWVEGALETLELDEEFAAVICWDALFHVERRHHEAVLARLAGMLAPGGRIMLTAGGSDDSPPFTDTMFGEQFFYDSWPPDETLAIMHRTGLEPVIFEYMNRPDGARDRGRIAIVARRPAPDAPPAP